MTVFTRHAAERARERTSMTLRDIRIIIDTNRAYPVGAEGNKTHWLFYSQIDDECYIAVNDIVAKEVVTVYHWQYHPRRCYFNINAQILENAKRLALGLPIATLAEMKLESEKERNDREHKDFVDRQREASRLRKLLPKFSIWAGDTKLVGINTESIGTWMEFDKEYFESVLAAILGAIKGKRITMNMQITSSGSSDKVRTPYPELAKIIVAKGGYNWTK